MSRISSDETRVSWFLGTSGRYIPLVDPAIVAAIIAGAVGLLTLVGSLSVQIFGIRRVSRDTDTIARKQLTEQREQLDRTLFEQREQLERTLVEQRLRTLNERFAAAADRLGANKPAAVRLAAVRAMAGLADDWAENRQTCVDVLCAYLRMPYAPDPGEVASLARRLASGQLQARDVYRRRGRHQPTAGLVGSSSVRLPREPAIDPQDAGAGRLEQL